MFSARRYRRGPGDGASTASGSETIPCPRLWEVAQLVAAARSPAADLVARVRSTAPSTSPAVCTMLPGPRLRFCYVTTPCWRFSGAREHGLRVAYVDIDAHHGDGVQHAFYADPNVMRSPRTSGENACFPAPASCARRARGGRRLLVILPLECLHRHRRVPAAFERYAAADRALKPDVIVAQRAWTRPHDPLTHLALDVRARRACSASPPWPRSSSRSAAAATICATSADVDAGGGSAQRHRAGADAARRVRRTTCVLRLHVTLALGRGGRGAGRAQARRERVRDTPVEEVQKTIFPVHDL